MPILDLKLSAAPSSELVSAASQILIDLTERILHKKRELMAITIDFVPPEHWVVGGATLAAQGKRSFYLDIKIVDGTNTKDDKAAYITAVFDGFGRLLGDLHDESYIHVHDVRADAYGFGGRTQEFRYIAAKR